MFHDIPQKCPDCKAPCYDQQQFLDIDWHHSAFYMEVVDEGGGTIGYEVYCHNCGRNIQED